MSDLTIRAEVPDDYDAIRDLVRAAFTEVFGAGDDEVGLIDTLRGRPEHDPALALVAERGGAVVGHILFSPVWFVDEPSIRAAVLAPLAVRLDCQRQGIGTRLVEEGLAACRKRDIQAVVTQGSVDYYPRFGFEPLEGTRLHTIFRSSHDLVLALEPGVLEGVTGLIDFPDLWQAFVENGDHE